MEKLRTYTLPRGKLSRHRNAEEQLLAPKTSASSHCKLPNRGATLAGRGLTH